ncbi:anti-sigma factor family protein [Tundrisphaera sp. TA3]|uniref:anti-sigma factor family protein n=1 Tax=Tundrisphaera sp. TA3 TaxID=3435775 RepID=UPI003EB8A8C7
MNLDDDTLLSAYLDDELDPADRMAVAWSIESSPPLAGRLSDLAATRDAVAGLGRPGIPRDLAPDLLARIASRQAARPRAGSRAASVLLAGGFVSIAASLLAAMFFVYRATHDLDRPTLFAFFPKATPAKAPAAPRAKPPTVPEQPASPADGAPMLARLAAPATDAAIPPPPASPTPTPVALIREAADRGKIAGMLERPDVHRILIVTDVIDAGDRVRSLIQRDIRKHPDFGRITVSEGIVIDPRHPGEADVFTLVMDGRESEPFLGKLARAFPRTDVVVEPRPDPFILTQLAEVGEASVLPGLAPNSPSLPLVLAMEDTPGTRASREDGRGSYTLPDMDTIAGIDGSLVVQDPDGDSPRGAPTRFPTSPGPATYLVWVARTTARR